ncbi:hypothetical protein B0A55_11070 [Friedmanniomyces simplex]|uniref:Uncharacterized protein n=1 Tax=Friedmanniomyces simplex TaxID=329884 RepID=A0A4U0WTX2_9PEZI|nr:hypothetical protein B0A55_11070 [Friedmanniomyces simplex]
MTSATQNYEGSRAGGEARRLAEAGGQATLHRYEEKVQTLLNMAEHTYPHHFKWFNMARGYIRGGGTHFVYHYDIDDIILGRSHRTVPAPVFVNSRTSTGVYNEAAHPPDVVHDLPMHDAHSRCMEGLARHDVPVHSERAWRLAGLGGGFTAPCVCARRLRLRVLENEASRRLSTNTIFVHRGIFMVGS